MTTSEAPPPAHPCPEDAGSGTVAVEVGADLGTLVLWTPAEMAGLELEITPDGCPPPWRHVWVLARRLSAQVAYAAVFPALPEGRYTVWGPGGQLTVEVPAGVVTEARLT